MPDINFDEIRENEFIDMLITFFELLGRFLGLSYVIDYFFYND